MLWACGQMIGMLAFWPWDLYLNCTMVGQSRQRFLESSSLVRWPRHATFVKCLKVLTQVNPSFMIWNWVIVTFCYHNYQRVFKQFQVIMTRDFSILALFKLDYTRLCNYGLLSIDAIPQYSSGDDVEIQMCLSRCLQLALTSHATRWTCLETTSQPLLITCTV